SPSAPRANAKRYEPSASSAPSPGSIVASCTERPSTTNPSEPSARSRSRPSLAAVTRTWCCSIARSGKWMVFSAARPIVSSSPECSRSRTISRPFAVRSMLRIRKVIGASPIVEHTDDVRGQRGEQHDRHRHVNEQPDLEHGLQPHVAPDLLELRQPLVKQRQDALEFGVALYQLVDRPSRAAIAMVPA